RVQYPGDKGRGFWDSLLAPEVTMDIGLASNEYARGEIIEGIVKVESPKPVKLRGIQLRLVGHEQCTADGHHDSHSYHGPVERVTSPETSEGGFSQTFSLTAAADGPPTAKGQLFSI